MALAVAGMATAQNDNALLNKIANRTNKTSAKTPASEETTKATSKTQFAFLMGWDGLGSSMFGGLQSDEKNAYSTKPWFNSWQLEIVYNFYKNNGVKIFAGVGYQSDVYKMSHDFIYLDRNYVNPATPGAAPIATMREADNTYFTTVANPAITDDRGWESRICMRYVNIPIGIDYAFSNDFGIGLTAVPGFNFATKHTGLKYKQNGDNQASRRDALDGYINPFKCDIRVNVNLSLVSIFAQVSPMPLFKDTDSDEVYPMRFGFMLKF